MPVASLFAESAAPCSRGCGILGIAIPSRTFFFLFATVRGQSIRKEKRMAVDESSSGAPLKKRGLERISADQSRFTSRLCQAAISGLMASEAFHERLTARSEAVARHMAMLAEPQLRRGGGLHIDRRSPHSQVPWRCA